MHQSVIITGTVVYGCCFSSMPHRLKCCAAWSGAGVMVWLHNLFIYKKSLEQWKLSMCLVLGPSGLGWVQPHFVFSYKVWVRSNFLFGRRGWVRWDEWESNTVSNSYWWRPHIILGFHMSALLNFLSFHYLLPLMAPHRSPPCLILLAPHRPARYPCTDHTLVLGEQQSRDA